MRTQATILSFALALWGAGAAAQAPVEGERVVPHAEAIGAEDDALDMSDFDGLASDPSLRDFGGAVDPEDLEGIESLVVEGGSASESEHEVNEGDTLWDVSDRYLGSPWLWPKIWSLNPQVENPHWIYPGDRIRISEGEAPVVGSEEAPFYFEEEDDLPAVSLSRRIAYQPAQRRVTTIGFVTDREVEDAAVVAKSWEEKTVLGEGDRIYLDWEKRDNLQPGSLFLIYRTDRRISSLGYLTRILGMARIVDPGADARYVTAVIEQSVIEIMRGDRVGPLRDLGRMVDRRPNRVELVGKVAGALEQGMKDFGQGHVVFIDKGRRDGVEAGNTFEAVRAADGLDDDGYTPRFDKGMPRELIGELLVVDVQEGASAALIVSSEREFRVGDRVEMRIQPSTASR